jgi:hypothetical protein
MGNFPWVVKAPWEFRPIIKPNLNEIQSTCPLSNSDERVDEHVQQRKKCYLQKNQVISAVIVYQKAENYLLKCELVGDRVMHVELREERQAKLEE